MPCQKGLKSDDREPESDAQRQAISKALQDERGNRTQAARSLGITFRAMRYRMERLKIA